MASVVKNEELWQIIEAKRKHNLYYYHHFQDFVIERAMVMHFQSFMEAAFVNPEVLKFLPEKVRE